MQNKDDLIATVADFLKDRDEAFIVSEEQTDEERRDSAAEIVAILVAEPSFHAKAMEKAARYHDNEAEYYSTRSGALDGVPFKLVAHFHRLHASAIRALSETANVGFKSERELVLEKALKPFSDIAGELFAMNYNENDVVFTVHRKTPKGSKISTSMTFKAFNNARAALPTSPGASE